jgi:hypothetical protein
VNANNEWIGSLLVESTGGHNFALEDIGRKTAEAANSIQYILPEYKEQP